MIIILKYPKLNWKPMQTCQTWVKIIFSSSSEKSIFPPFTHHFTEVNFVFYGVCRQYQMQISCAVHTPGNLHTGDWHSSTYSTHGLQSVLPNTLEIWWKFFVQFVTCKYLHPTWLKDWKISLIMFILYNNSCPFPWWVPIIYLYLYQNYTKQTIF